VAALTRSGAGVRVEREELAALAEAQIASHFRGLLDQHRFVVLARGFDALPAAVEFLGRLGRVNHAATRVDGAVVVEDQGAGEVFRSHAALPLHKDGVLTGFDVAVVGIFCLAFEQVQRGRTFVSDAVRALQRVPAADVATLREHGIEAMAVDSTGYYRPEFAGTWNRFPAFRAARGREPSLNIGLPHAAGEPESWRVRVADVPLDVSDRVLAALRRALLDEEFTYHHDWSEGDLLLLDNYAVLHGREAFTARSRRMANIQVLTD
jgi:L-tyrosine isonitrile desaturase/decarboxylase